MEKSGANVESRAWLRVLGSLDEVDHLGIQKSRCLCKDVPVGDGGDRGREASRGMVLLIGAEADMCTFKESIPQPVTLICS